MNARVFLLLLFTLAFMGVWDADRPAASLAKAIKQETPVSESVTLSQAAAEAFIPLPKNLAAGTWQVMTESGEFYRVTIEKSGSDSAAKEDGAEVVEEESFSAITTADGVRWCFIRAVASPQLPGSDHQASAEFFEPGAN